MKKIILMVSLVLFSLVLLSCAAQLKNSPQETKTENGMVIIPGDWFIMGSDSGEINEGPAHEVFVETFKVDKYEVSAKEFAEFLNAQGNPDNKYFSHDEYSTVIGVSKVKGKEVETIENPRKYISRKGFEKYPANNVSWHGAYAFCQWKGKRLPTEAEWEKAARGVDERIYPWGSNSPDDSKARYKQNWDKQGLSVMVPVNSLINGQSPYGVSNLSGNVWEWIADWYRQNYCDYCDPSGELYIEAVAEILGMDKAAVFGDTENPNLPPKSNPQGPKIGKFKILRGGSWHDRYDPLLRSTYRYWLDPLERYRNTGFRCAQEVDKEPKQDASDQKGEASQ